LRIFAPLRDTHVQLIAVGELVGEDPELSLFRCALAKRERRLTKRVAKKFKHTGIRKVAKAVATIRMDLCSLWQDQEQEEKNLHAVMEEVGAAYRAVTERLRAVDPADPATIHRTRVAFKKFRYMTEALQPLLSSASDRVLKRMQDYQCCMGNIQDATVLRSSLESFLSKHKCQTSVARGLLAKLGRRRVALVTAFMKQASALSDFTPPKHRLSGLRSGIAGRQQSK
jgi:CHAD domain-containing protein